MMAPVSTDIITVFRVLVSGEPHTFDELDSAMEYMRAQAAFSKALDNSRLIIESAQVSIDQYRLEVDKQEGVAA